MLSLIEAIETPLKCIVSEVERSIADVASSSDIFRENPAIGQQVVRFQDGYDLYRENIAVIRYSVEKFGDRTLKEDAAPTLIQ